jgi:hypothetical protein
MENAISIDHWFSYLNPCLNHTERLLKHRLLGTRGQSFPFGRPKNGISRKFPSTADAAGQRITL